MVKQQKPEEETGEEVKDDNWTGVFELDTETVPVTLKNKDKSERKCELREMSGFRRDIYLNKDKNRVTGSGINRKVTDFKNVQANLIHECLFDLATDEQVPIADIGDFPSKVQQALYKKCMEINGFEDGAENDAKNS